MIDGLIAGKLYGAILRAARPDRPACNRQSMMIWCAKNIFGRPCLVVQ